MRTLCTGQKAPILGHEHTLHWQKGSHISALRHFALAKRPQYMGMGTHLPSLVQLAIVSGVNHYVHCARDRRASALRLAPPTPSRGHCPCSAAAATSLGAGPRPPVPRLPGGGGGKCLWATGWGCPLVPCWRPPGGLGCPDGGVWLASWLPPTARSVRSRCRAGPGAGWTALTPPGGVASRSPAPWSGLRGHSSFVSQSAMDPTTPHGSTAAPMASAPLPPEASHAAVAGTVKFGGCYPAYRAWQCHTGPV